MKKTILKITVLSLFAAAVIAAPTIAHAQLSTNGAAATATGKKAKKAASLPFSGKLKSIDTNAMTVTVGKRTFEVTSETKITKDGQPATLKDGVIDETVSGAYKKETDGKLVATSVSYTAKAGTKKKKKTAEVPDASTNPAAK